MAFVHQNGDAMPTMVARHALSGGQTPRASMALWQLEAGGSRGARQSALGAAMRTWGFVEPTPVDLGG